MEPLPYPYTPVTPVAFGPGTTDTPIIATQAVILGWSVSETTGAASASFRWVDGRDVNGTPASGIVNLLANESDTEALGDLGIECRRGVFLDVRSGSVEGVVYVVFPDNVRG